MLKKGLFIMSMLIISNQFISQSNYGNENSENQYSKMFGTYQIEIIGRQDPLLPANLYQIVSENRDSNKITYVKLGTMLRIKILPYSVINSPNFTPLNEEIVSVESFQNYEK